MMRLTWIIAILNSHEVWRRNLIHWRGMSLPADLEILIMDDGSDPPLVMPPDLAVPNLRIVPTHDTRPWTTSLARNAGARLAEADYILFTDIDHYLLQDAILDCHKFACGGFPTADRFTFHREFGVLREDGTPTQDIPTVLSYGLDPARIPIKGLRAPAHGNSFVMRKDLFWQAGGYGANDYSNYPPMDESRFRGRYREMQHAGKCTTEEYRPTIYMIPNGYYCGDPDYNPHGLFHTLSRQSWKHSQKFKAEQERRRREELSGPAAV
jgi:hypothetical protein